MSNDVKQSKNNENDNDNDNDNVNDNVKESENLIFSPNCSIIKLNKRKQEETCEVHGIIFYLLMKRESYFHKAI